MEREKKVIPSHPRCGRGEVMPMASTAGDEQRRKWRALRTHRGIMG
jgi:hypothetical protein